MLKNILIVVASMLVWGTIVGGLQALGFSIALVGLVYYSIGHDAIVAYCSEFRYSKLRDVELDEESEDEYDGQRVA